MLAATPIEGGGPVAATEAVETRRSLRWLRFAVTITAILLLLFGLPWWTLLVAARWPAPVILAGSVLFAAALVAFPVLMYLGHGRRHLDRAAATGDTILGVIWVLFSWALIGNVATAALAVAGVADPLRSRIVAGGAAAISLVLCVGGYAEAMRVPRIRRIDVTIPRLDKGLDGTRVVLITDTHYGPINRARWSKRVTGAVNALDPDIVCHTGDIADGTVAQRRAQAAPL